MNWEEGPIWLTKIIKSYLVSYFISWRRFFGRCCHFFVNLLPCIRVLSRSSNQLSLLSNLSSLVVNLYISAGVSLSFVRLAWLGFVIRLTRGGLAWITEYLHDWNLEIRGISRECSWIVRRALIICDLLFIVCFHLKFRERFEILSVRCLYGTPTHFL